MLIPAILNLKHWRGSIVLKQYQSTKTKIEIIKEIRTYSTLMNKASSRLFINCQPAFFVIVIDIKNISKFGTNRNWIKLTKITL